MALAPGQSPATELHSSGVVRGRAGGPTCGPSIWLPRGLLGVSSDLEVLNTHAFGMDLLIPLQTEQEIHAWQRGRFMICTSFFGVESVFLFPTLTSSFGLNVSSSSLWVLFLWLAGWLSGSWIKSVLVGQVCREGVRVPAS